MAFASHRQGFPCCHVFLLPYVPTPLPRRERFGVFVAYFPIRHRPSPRRGWVGSRITVFEACSAFTRVPARMVAELLSQFFCLSASDHVVTSIIRSVATNRSDNCCAGFAPARKTRLSTAHHVYSDKNTHVVAPFRTQVKGRPLGADPVETDTPRVSGATTPHLQRSNKRNVRDSRRGHYGILPRPN